MKKLLVILFLSGFTIALVSFSKESLRSIYSRPPATWPKPFVDEEVQWKELGQLPASPIENEKDSLRHLIELGKALFFDTRLSSSGKISCATCHQPELSWTDGKKRSVGHEGAMNKRNAPTIQNAWFYKKLFWDGRAKDLEDQAFAPINSETEMHSEMATLPYNLRQVKGYALLFNAAYGDPGIDPDRIAHAIAVFEQTITSRRSRFDDFLAGKKNALTNSELRGLHLFRTKARCMNCHNGPMFSDNQFHNIGFSADDPGLYKVTHKEEDMGKFKTPSLRDVMKTGPWMHDGSMNEIKIVIEKLDQPLMLPGTDRLIRSNSLTANEKLDLIAFLNAISSSPAAFKKPVLPE